MKKLFGLILSFVMAFGVLGLTGCSVTSKKTPVSIFSRPTVEKVAGQKKDWNDVDSFSCYYGSLNGNAESEPALGGEPERALDVLKNFDVAIIHSSQLFSEADAKNLVKELQDAGTYVIAYISIGEDTALRAGDGLGENGYASYYIYENGEPKKNSSWGSYFVDAGNPVWQAMVLDSARSILDFGVDGLFLDTVDTVDVAYATVGGMVDLIKKLDETFPEAKLVPNRGFTVYLYVSQYVDGIMFESFWTTYQALPSGGGIFVDRGEDELAYNTTIACNVVNRARRYDYMPVFCLDYVNKSEYAYMPQGIMNEVWQYDFISYVTYSRALDVCPNPKVKPTSERGKLALSKLSEDSSTDTTQNGDTSSANLAYVGNGLAKVTVDSTLTGYGTKAINDGFYATTETHNQTNWATESWASARDPNKDHWIQFTFDDAQTVSEVKVYWAVDGEGSSPVTYSPRQAYVEVWLNDEWVKVGEYNWKQGESYLTRQESTVFTFDAVQTTRVRIVQPKGMGDGTNSRLDGQETTFSVLMWVGEIEIR